MVTPHGFQDVSSLTRNWTLTLGSESMESSPLNNQGILKIFGIFEVRKGYLWTGERVENWGMKTVKANLTSYGAQETQELILSCQLWGFIFTSILPQVPWKLWSNTRQRGVHKLHSSLSWAEKEGRKEMKERNESKPLVDFRASLFCRLWAVGDLMALWDLRADRHCHWGLSSLRLLSSLFLKKFILLKYWWYTMLCSFLLYSKVIQLYIYIYFNFYLCIGPWGHMTEHAHMHTHTHLFIFGCTGSLLWCLSFSLLWLSSCRAWALGTWASAVGAQRLSSFSSQALEHRLNSCDA